MAARKGRPSANSEDARAALIAAARQKFVGKPYDKVSIRELAQLAGVSSAMIKYYFHNKEGLYKAMIMEITGQVMANLKSHLSSGEFSSIEGFFRSFVDVIKQTPEFPILMLKELILNQGICREYLLQQLGQNHLRVIDEVFDHFQAQGKLKPQVDRSLFVLSLMSLNLNPWYMRELMGVFKGVTYDDEFLEKLIVHNTLLIEQGCFTGVDND